MSDNASRAKQYRARAEELQLLAVQVSTVQAEQTCVELATDYLQMAARLERFIADKSR